MQTNSKDLVTPARAATLLGVARNTVMHRIANGRYAVERYGGVTFVVLESLDADLASKDAAEGRAA